MCSQEGCPQMIVADLLKFVHLGAPGPGLASLDSKLVQLRYADDTL